MQKNDPLEITSSLDQIHRKHFILRMVVALDALPPHIRKDIPGDTLLQKAVHIYELITNSHE